MSKISEIAKASQSRAFKHLNPGFFGLPTHNTYKVTPEPSKTATSQPERKLGHSRSGLEVKFLNLWSILHGPELEEEYRFHPGRKFRVDFCHLATRTCIEIEGGIFNRRGGHSSVTGVLRDIEKYNEMTFLGFRLVRFHAKEGVNGSVDVANLTRLIQFLDQVRP